MIDTDYSQRFLFENSHIRGERIHLSDSLETALATHSYPESIRILLGELSAIALLLSSSLKYSGTFSLQARSEGPISLLMVECTDQQHFRAVARYSKDASFDHTSLAVLLPNGQLLINAASTKGKQYQSIVALNKDTLADCFTAYFHHSEQLPTKIWLACDGQKASGLLLQSLPVTQDIANHEAQQKEASEWEHALIITDTVKTDELLTLSNPALLYRLFNEDDIRLFDQKPVTYQCTCSRERIAQSLISLGKQELTEMGKDNHPVEIQCQFCNKQYMYSPDNIQQLCQSFH